MHSYPCTDDRNLSNNLFRDNSGVQNVAHAAATESQLYNPENNGFQPSNELVTNPDEHYSASGFAANGSKWLKYYTNLSFIISSDEISYAYFKGTQSFVNVSSAPSFRSSAAYHSTPLPPHHSSCSGYCRSILECMTALRHQYDEMLQELKNVKMELQRMRKEGTFLDLDEYKISTVEDMHMVMQQLQNPKIREQMVKISLPFHN